MTEYDYSPEAYQRYLATQTRIAKWVDNTERHRPQFETAVPTSSNQAQQPSSGWRKLFKRSPSPGSGGRHRPADIYVPPPESESSDSYDSRDHHSGYRSSHGHGRSPLPSPGLMAPHQQAMFHHPLAQQPMLSPPPQMMIPQGYMQPPQQYHHRSSRKHRSHSRSKSHHSPAYYTMASPPVSPGYQYAAGGGYLGQMGAPAPYIMMPPPPQNAPHVMSTTHHHSAPPSVIGVPMTLAPNGTPTPAPAAAGMAVPDYFHHAHAHPHAQYLAVGPGLQPSPTSPFSSSTNASGGGAFYSPSPYGPGASPGLSPGPSPGAGSWATYGVGSPAHSMLSVPNSHSFHPSPGPSPMVYSHSAPSSPFYAPQQPPLPPLVLPQSYATTPPAAFQPFGVVPPHQQPRTLNHPRVYDLKGHNVRHSVG